MKKNSLMKACSFLFTVCLFAGCSANQTNTSEKTNNAADGCEDSSETAACDSYETLSFEDDFTPISFDDAIAMFENKDSGIVYFGFPKCPWCQDVVPILDALAKEEGLTVYYVQTRDADLNRLYTDEQKEIILPYIEEFMSENDEGEMTLYVPLVLSIRDGQIQDGHQGTVDGHDAKEREMTQEETQQLTDDLKALLQTQTSKS